MEETDNRSNGPGHVYKMAATPIVGNCFKNIV